MQPSKALPIAPTASALTVWTDPAGVPYLVKKSPDGSTIFTPLATALAQPQPPATTERVTTYRDPMAALLIGFGALLGVILLGYGIGFFAGAAGQRVVLVPSTPVCNTHRSSFLFWSSENKECN